MQSIGADEILFALTGFPLGADGGAGRAATPLGHECWGLFLLHVVRARVVSQSG